MATPLKIRADVDMDSLVRAARESSDAVDNLSQSFDDVGTQSTRGTDKAATALQGVSRDAQTAKTDVSGVGGATGEVAGQLQGLGDVAAQALGGDVPGAVDTALGSLSGLAGAIPGVAGVVGAALVGAITTWIQSLDMFGQKTAEIKDSVSQSLVDVGGAFTTADLSKRVNDVVSDTETWAAANTIAAATGMDLADVVAGLAGDADKAREAHDKLKVAIDQAYSGKGPAAMFSGKDLQNAQTAINGVTQGLQDGASKAQVAKSAIAGINSEASKSNDLLGNLGMKLQNLPDGKTKIVVDDSQVKAYTPPRKKMYVDVVPIPGKAQLQ